MTHRERIMNAINHLETDRIPLDYWGVGEVTEKLRRHFGVKTAQEAFDILGIDNVVNVVPRFIATDERDNLWGVKNKEIFFADGSSYTESEFNPIGNCESIEEIESRYTFPDVEMFDYSVIPEQIKNARGHAVEAGYISLTYFYTQIRGVEQMLLDFIAEPKIAEYILERLEEFSYEHVKRILEAADGKADITQVTDDFGSQSSLLCSKQMIDEFLGKYYDKNIAMVKNCGSHVFHHDDGAIMQLIPWLEGKGIEVLNPLQWHLPGWNLEELKSMYGEKICFHGGVDNQKVLPFGSEEDVRQEVRDCMNALYGDRKGYILAPCHNIQANTPIENILAMYDEAKKYQT